MEVNGIGKHIYDNVLKYGVSTRHLSLITAAGQLYCENLPMLAPVVTRSSTHAGGEEKEVVAPMDIDSADRRLQ